MQLKHNQPILRQKFEAVRNTARPLSRVQISATKKRNRHATRTISVFDATPAIARTQWAPHVTAIIQVERSVHSFQTASGLWKSKHESSLYLSSRRIDAALAAHAIRAHWGPHWGIENKLHYTRDVTLREDASRIRKNPEIFARLRSFAYNILRFNQSDTIAQDRYAAALGGLKAIMSLRFSIER